MNMSLRLWLRSLRLWLRSLRLPLRLSLRSLRPLRLWLCIILLGLFSAGFLSALSADVDYAEGEAIIQEKLGEEFDIQIGDVVETGDEVKTGIDGYVELLQGNAIVKISSETIFTLREKADGQEKRRVLSCILGSAQFKIQKLRGTAPVISSNSCAAGVRGTELTVFAGADGSTLILVEEGIVAVEALGELVELAKEEGVEVEPGSPPGEKFSVQRDQIDYSTWNARKLSAMMDDPITSLEKIEKRFDYYIDEIENRYPAYLEKKEALMNEREELGKIGKEKDKDAQSKYYRENVFPLEVETTYLYLNIRYFALASLSLRRYVLGRMYLFLKSRYFSNPQDQVFRSFLDHRQQVLTKYEDKIVPFLVEADI